MLIVPSRWKVSHASVRPANRLNTCFALKSNTSALFGVYMYGPSWAVMPPGARLARRKYRGFLACVMFKSARKRKTSFSRFRSSLFETLVYMSRPPLARRRRWFWQKFTHCKSCESSRSFSPSSSLIRSLAGGMHCKRVEQMWVHPHWSFSMVSGSTVWSLALSLLADLVTLDGVFKCCLVRVDLDAFSVRGGKSVESA